MRISLRKAIAMDPEGSARYADANPDAYAAFMRMSGDDEYDTDTGRFYRGDLTYTTYNISLRDMVNIRKHPELAFKLAFANRLERFIVGRFMQYHMGNTP